MPQLPLIAPPPLLAWMRVTPFFCTAFLACAVNGATYLLAQSYKTGAQHQLWVRHQSRIGAPQATPSAETGTGSAFRQPPPLTAASPSFPVTPWIQWARQHGIFTQSMVAVPLKQWSSVLKNHPPAAVVVWKWTATGSARAWKAFWNSQDQYADTWYWGSWQLQATASQAMHFTGHLAGNLARIPPWETATRAYPTCTGSWYFPEWEVPSLHFVGSDTGLQTAWIANREHRIVALKPGDCMGPNATRIARITSQSVHLTHPPGILHASGWDDTHDLSDQ